ncbi:heterodimeric methylmalonyl-CoA mutase small subunit [Ureibacillus xyleni]|uniref:Heterodimeric methylmalonyl-CoA mutase small subunit n=1 Tax=Ureibacillus xyleni TaxID=614648 RepID=A0A285SC28_9BACL|nr:methylmalonyl-CoA mutase family protein [Ureibacillus xyleni]SOC05092.1 heterodimeric methylmalonyl-CoA mutase small subunit [Ureibacillus xyleni]
MSIQMKDIEFQTASYDQWKEEAIKALKGKPFETLFTNLAEDVTLSPLYTQSMLVDKLGEDLEKQIATIRSLQSSEQLLAAQQIFGDTAEQFFAGLQDSIERGNNCITIDSRTTFKWEEENLQKLASYLIEYPFKFIVQNKNDSLLQVFNKFEQADKEKVNGFIISDSPVELDDFDNVRTFCANTVTYHYEGANAVQELAIALAIAAKQVKENNFEQFSKNFFVNFAIDTQFFVEIAKLRAFRVLWKAFSSAYGVTNPIAVPIVAENSLRSYSKLDVYVNLLRAGNEAFSGLIGGADAFTVHPHDVLSKPTDKSIRIARNVLLVLKEESQVENVLDPAGGSYFVETLTAEFVEKAWALFLEIEEFGGFDAYVESGKLQASIVEVYNDRLKAVETRKQSLIGTNIYANPVDELPAETNETFASIKRLPIPFEQLREKYNAAQPKIAILTFGKLKDFKPRADFVAGFFATAGVTPDQSGEILSVEIAKEWLQNVNYDYVIVAAKDEDTKELVPTLLSVKPENLILDAAGKFKDEQSEWLEKGLNGFIFAGQNIVEKLNEVLESVKGVQQ